MSNLKKGRGNSPYYKTMDTRMLSDKWFDFVANNQHRATNNHTAVFFLCLEIYIRTEGKEGFLLDPERERKYIGGLDTSMLGNILYDLSAFGFISYRDTWLDSWRITLKWHSAFNYN